ncbi:hypothetical protein VYU27_006320 [Nannochloropsis oceanica]
MSIGTGALGLMWMLCVSQVVAFRPVVMLRATAARGGMITTASSCVALPVAISLPCKRLYSTIAESTDAASDQAAAEELEKDVLKSECGVDYVPLANMLLTGDFKAADQFTRDALIQIAGEDAQKRGYVYFTEVRGLPEADMATIEKLWLKYSKGKFGFTVQRAIWNQVTVGKDFERFCRKIGWNMMENGIERKLKWFGNSEFIYDLDKAPPGHLPLTSALRGTSLLKNLLTYPLWETDWNKEEKKE